MYYVWFCSLLPRLTLLLSFFGHPALPPPRGGSASRVSPLRNAVVFVWCVVEFIQLVNTMMNHEGTPVSLVFAVCCSKVCCSVVCCSVVCCSVVLCSVLQCVL